MTKGNIIDMLGDGAVQFDKGEITIVRDGKEYDVLEVMYFGERMSNKEIWQYEQFTQPEIDKIYKETKELVDGLDSYVKKLGYNTNFA